MIHRYETRERGADPACRSEDGLLLWYPARGRTQLLYNRKLTAAEVKCYDLKYLGTVGDTDMAKEKKRRAVYNHDAQMRYLAKLKQLNIRIKAEDYSRYDAFAKSKGLSLRALVLQAIEEKIERG